MAAIPTAPAVPAQPAAPPSDPPVQSEELPDADWGAEVPFAGDAPAETVETPADVPAPPGDETPAETPAATETPAAPAATPPARVLTDETVDALWTNEQARDELLKHPEAQKILDGIAQQRAQEQQEIITAQPENDPVWVQAAQAGVDALTTLDADLKAFQAGTLEDPAKIMEGVRSVVRNAAVATRQASFHQIHMALVADVNELTGGKSVEPALQQRYETALTQFQALNADPDPKKANLALSRVEREFAAIRRELYEPMAKKQGATEAEKNLASQRELIESNVLRELTAQGKLGQGTAGIGGIPPAADADLSAATIANMNDEERDRRLDEILAWQRQNLGG